MENATKQKSVGKRGKSAGCHFWWKYGEPLLSTPFHLLKIWEQIVQHFLNIFQKIAFVLSVSLEEFQFLITYLPSLHIHS